MKKLFGGGKSKTRTNGSSRDLSQEEQPVPTPIHSKLATISPPQTATLTKLSPAQKARQQQEDQPRPPQGTTPPADDDPERWEVVSAGHVPTPLESPTNPHIVPPSRSSSYTSIPPALAAQQRPASPAASFTMKQQLQPGARPGAGAQVYNQLAALGPALPTKKPPAAPAAVALLKSLEPPRPALEPLGSRYSDYGDRHSLSDHSLQQAPHPPALPEKEHKRRFWQPKDKGAKDVQPPPSRDIPGARQESSHGHGYAGAYDEPTKDLTRRIGEPDPSTPPHHAHSHHFPHPSNHHHHNDARRIPTSTPTTMVHPQPVITFTPRNITESIGYLAATASEDFALVYDVCDRASASEANAKEAVKALRSEFKYGEPRAQLSAARLWAVMLHNSSPIFVVQSRSRKFMDTIEDLLTSPRTNPVVKERLLDVVGAAAYATRHHSKQDGFQALWRKVKPADKPDEGVPFDTEDPMFNPAPPPSTRNSQFEGQQQFEVPYGTGTPAQMSPGFQQTPVSTPRERDDRERRGDRERERDRDKDRDRERDRERTGGPRQQRKSPTRNRIIPLEEDIRRLLQECKIGIGNAELLSGALSECEPEEVRGNEIIEEFTMKCRSSQELVFAQIPWATAQAERSRQARDAEHEARAKQDVTYKRARDDADETLEEKLLARLLLANEALIDALRLYNDTCRIADERRADEYKRKDLVPRMGPYSNGGGNSNLTASHPSIDDSRSRSRSATPPSIRSMESRDKGGSTFSHGHSPAGLPQGPRDPHYHHQQHQAANLAPPPPSGGPHGPRSPGQFSIRTRTPSPSGGGSFVDQQQQAAAAYQQQQYGIHTPNTATPNTATPNGGHSYHHGHDRYQQQQQNAQAYGHDDAGSMYGGGLGSANGHAVRYDYRDADDDAEVYEDGTPIRPSAKALGKRKLVEPDPTDSPHASDPDLANHINPSLDAIDNLSDMDAESLLELTNRADNENENGGVLLESPTAGPGRGKHGGWPGQKPVQFVYDAAAERTKMRLEEAQRMLERGMNLNGVPVVH